MQWSIGYVYSTCFISVLNDKVIIMLTFIESKITNIVLMTALWNISYVKIEHNGIYSSYMCLYVYGLPKCFWKPLYVTQALITEKACVLEFLKHLYFSIFFESAHAWLLV